MFFEKLLNIGKTILDNDGKEILEKLTSSETEKIGSKAKVQTVQLKEETPAKANTQQTVPAEPAKANTQQTVPAEPAKGNTPATTENGIMKVHDGMSSEEDEQFVQSLQNGFSNMSAKTPAEAVMALKTFATATKETIKFVKSQEVKRENILAERDKKLAQIEATKQILQDYLNKTFDERKDTFNKYFAVVDTALENGDNTALTAALDSINNLAASSPFKDLSNMSTFKEIMSNKDEDLDI